MSLICYDKCEHPLVKLGKHIMRQYTKEQKAQTLILLAANRGDISLTASQTGISRMAISGWAESERQSPSHDIGKGMEVAIHYLMGQIPHLVNKYNIAELLGTLLEKWLQYQGVPQNSTQTILTILATKTEDQLDRMINDIETGRQLQLSGQGQVIDLEKEMERLGLIGLKEKISEEPLSDPNEADIIDLIEYQDYSPDKEDDHKDW